MLLWITFFYYYYPQILTKPNHFLFNAKRDGIKNYYTYTYYINNDTSYINSNCSNYPHGEHFSFLDSTPALSIPIKALSQVFPSIKNYNIAIFNYFLIFSFVLGSWCAYLILRYYEVPAWWSVVFSFLVVVFSPQFSRLFGHYALAYTPALLLSWYLLIKFLDKPTYRKAVLIAAVQLIHFFIHIYFPIIFWVFAIPVLIAHILKERKAISSNFYTQVAVQIIIPLVIFFSFMHFTDKHKNRTDSPAGISFYKAKALGMFFSKKSPFYIIYPNSIKKKNVDYEAVNYVGISTSLIMLFCIGLAVYLAIKKRYEDLKEIFFPRHWDKFLIGAVVIILFSTYILYELGLHVVLLYLKPLRNIRSLGRFAWMFYYFLTIFCIIFFYRIIQYLNKKATQSQNPDKAKLFLRRKRYVNSIAILLLSMHLIEVYAIHQNYVKDFQPAPNIFNTAMVEDKKLLHVMKTIPKEKYQAILGIPIESIGSEDFLIEADNQAVHSYQILWAYHTGLPLVNNVTSRTSLDETKGILELILLPEYYDKTHLKRSFNFDKPLIMLIDKSSNMEHVNFLANKYTKKLYEDDWHIAVEFYPDRFLDYNVKEILEKYYIMMNSPHKTTHKLTYFYHEQNKDLENLIYFNTFDSLNSEVSRMGSGALKLKNKRRKNHVIHTFDANNLNQDSLKCEISFWLYHNLPGGTLCAFAVEEINSKGQKKWINNYVGGRFSHRLYQGWSLIRVPFTMRKNHKYKLLLTYEFSYVKYYYIDNLIIKPLEVEVFHINKTDSQTSDILLWNNEFIKIKKGTL
ncbi:MAG: hypothetical protein RML94_04015 [Bacteroidia bacterium]|nr:hypothetical protein [Bacteroidia bacterium]